MLAANGNVTWTKKHSLKSKWNILFDKSTEWISFKPQVGLKVYPCYSCKNMFSSKLTFQDHINRRVVIIKYKCVDCSTTFTFYNRCAFLLHARKHFTMSEGHVNLANVDIHLLPVKLAGFTRHESIPFLYDEDEEFGDNTYINCQFYSPDVTECGKQLVSFKPFNLVFHYSEGTTNVLLVLKQISTNVPLCEFVTHQTKVMELRVPNGHPEVEIKKEVEEPEEAGLPVISKIVSLSDKAACSECSSTPEVPMGAHFLGNNRPLDESLCCYICKYVAPTKCSLKAHVRTHENVAPFVCPECGKVFRSSSLLTTHMEEKCFHLSKNVRFRCPALKCGKLFVLRNTYTSHFTNHLQAVTKCSACTTTFSSEEEFAEHAHDGCTPTINYNCLVCKNTASFTHEESAEHINWHLQDRERCVYIFTCRNCRSYFRSTATFAVHKHRCQKTHPALVTAACQFCGQKIQFREKDNFKTCVACKHINQVNVEKDEEKSAVCVLCKEEVTPEDKKEHEKQCRYNNPVVAIPALDEETSSSALDSSDETPKKRKRSGKKKPDVQTETLPFDGTYYCKLCEFKTTERAEFHGHVVTHRDVSTAYQCMECGECFVVKPSLVRHLAHFHKITGADEYFAENECFDKFAIEKLENSQKTGPREVTGPVEENQCTVCLEQFEDALTLSKHFRIHGMAFLLKKTK